MRVRGGALLLVLGVSLGVAGCSAEAEPTPLPPVPSASPSPTPLAVPPEAMAETAEGAEAFARYFFQLLNEAFALSDSRPLRAISDAGCEGCRNLIDAIEEGSEPGEQVTGGEYRVLAAVAPAFQNGDVIVDVRYSLSEVRVEDLSGRLIETVPAVPAVDAQIRLLHDSSSWRVMGFRNVPQ